MKYDTSGDYYRALGEVLDAIRELPPRQATQVLEEALAVQKDAARAYNRAFGE